MKTISLVLKELNLSDEFIETLPFNYYERDVFCKKLNNKVERNKND